MTKEIFGLSGREEILATQEAAQAVLVDVASKYEVSTFDETESDCARLLAECDEMDMSGAGGPGEDR